MPAKMTVTMASARDINNGQRKALLTKALAVGRKRRQRGKLWPMPIRESDLGHIYTDVTIRALGGAKKKWTGRILVDTGATDTFAPASALRMAGIKPAGRRSYEL